MDAAWNRIAPSGKIAVSRGDVIKLGKDLMKSAKYPDNFGLGPGAYIAEIDVFHQIHCLNVLRKDIYFDYYYGAFYLDEKPSKLHLAETSRCIYILLQNLMCAANVDIFTHNWAQGQLHPVPDMSISHKC